MARANHALTGPHKCDSFSATASKSAPHVRPPTEEGDMKDGLRFVDSDMHIMEPPDLFDRYLDPTFKHRVSVPVGSDGRPYRGPSGLMLIDGLPTSDSDLQQYRKRIRRGPTQSTQP